MGFLRSQFIVASLLTAACGGSDAGDEPLARQAERLDNFTAGGEEIVCAALFLRMAEDRKYGFDRQENLLIADIFLKWAGKRADKIKALELARSDRKFGTEQVQACRHKVDTNAALRADLRLHREDLERRAAIAGQSANAF